MMTVRINFRPLLVALGAGVVFVLVFAQIIGSKPHRGHAGSMSTSQGILSDREYRRALQYEGSGDRIRRLLDKASRGEPIIVSVIGGSGALSKLASNGTSPVFCTDKAVSKGRGLTPNPSLSPRHGNLTNAQLVRRTRTDTGHTSHLAIRAGGIRTAAPTLYSRENMHVLVFEWLKGVFPHSGHSLVNGAQGAVGAEYFGWCFKEHISEDADLVIIELGINGLVEVSGYGSYERLIRSVLEMKNKPAVINIETFTLLFSPIISPSAMHHDICAFYDVPSLSIRDILLPRILADPDQEIPRWFRTSPSLSLLDGKVREYGGQAVDMMHISAAGHALAAELIIRYLQSQMRQSRHSRRWRNDAMSSEEDLNVPGALLAGPYDPTKPIPISRPVCRSMNSAHLHSWTAYEAGRTHADDGEVSEGMGGVRGLVLAEGSEGWTQWAWQEKRYLVAKQPGSIAKFDFITSPPSFPPPLRSPVGAAAAGQAVIDRPNRAKWIQNDRHHHNKRAAVPVPVEAGRIPTSSSDARGSVAIAHQRSKFFGLGRLSCWVDDNVTEAKLVDGYWEVQERNMGVVTVIASNLEPGPHTLTCKLLRETSDDKGRTEFRIIAVVHD